VRADWSHSAMAPVVSFTITEEGVTCLREAISCLSKFNEEFCMEARADRVRSSELSVS
jgi:hypothetical protein